MKNFRYFSDVETFTSERKNNYSEPWVSWTDGGGVNYNKSEEEKLGEPFTIEALGNGNITWALGPLTVQYSKNGGSWENMTKNTTISVNSGDSIAFKSVQENGYNGYTISTTMNFNVRGNSMSLFKGDNFVNENTIPSYAFYGLFSGCTKLISAEHLILPAMNLTTYCYRNMFSGCTSLIKAPKLPAMKLVTYGYRSMFSGCTSLTTAPELPAKTLYDDSYREMFKNCSNLNYIKCMAENLEFSKSMYWVEGVSATGTFVKSADVDSLPTGSSGIPDGWTVVDV